MSCRKAWVFLVSALALLSSPAAAADPPLQPSNPWLVDYALTDCTAQRTYGTASSVTIAFRPSPFGDTYEILLVTKRPGPRFAEELMGSVDFGEGPIKAWLLHYGAGDRNLGVYKFRIPAEAMSQARSAQAVTLHISGTSDFTLALQSMPKLLSGLDECRIDLQHYWNMTPTEQKELSAPAVGDVRPVFTSDDYPGEAQLRGQEGEATFLLFIDEKGAVAACHVVKPSGVPAFDVMGCQVILKRAKFKPAVDVKGHPVRSSVITPPVVWRLQG